MNRPQVEEQDNQKEGQSLSDMENNPVFNLEEIFFIAIRIEKNGEEFYKALRDRVIDSRTKAIFNFLGEEERRHVDIFREFHKNLEKDIPDYSNAIYADLPQVARIANQAAFLHGKAQALLKKRGDPGNLIDFAVESEEDTIKFYEELQAVVHERYRPAIKILIDEEKNHRLKLLELKDHI